MNKKLMKTTKIKSIPTVKSSDLKIGQEYYFTHLINGRFLDVYRHPYVGKDSKYFYFGKSLEDHYIHLDPRLFVPFNPSHSLIYIFSCKADMLSAVKQISKTIKKENKDNLELAIRTGRESRQAYKEARTKANHL